MKEYVKAIDGLPMILKLIVAIFLGPIVFGIYRVCKGHLISGLLFIFTAFFIIGYFIDIFTVLTKDKITFLA